MKEDAKKMADLLRSGHTMLNRACPICKNPIFRSKDGLDFCPICNRKVIFVNNNTNQELIKDKVKKQTLSKNKISPIQEMRDIILGKIETITQKLKNETQIDLIEKYSNILLNFSKILNKISDMN